MVGDVSIFLTLFTQENVKVPRKKVGRNRLETKIGQHEPIGWIYSHGLGRSPNRLRVTKKSWRIPVSGPHDYLIYICNREKSLSPALHVARGADTGCSERGWRLLYSATQGRLGSLCFTDKRFHRTEIMSEGLTILGCVDWSFLTQASET